MSAVSLRAATRGGDYRGDGGTRPPQHFGWGDAKVNVPPLIANLVKLFFWSADTSLAHSKMLT